MVLDALASYLTDMLRKAAEEELRLLLGITGEIHKLRDKLGDLKRFLADADRRNITDESVQEWVGMLKSAMYEATDILDLFELKKMERSSSSVDTGCFNALLFCMQNPLHAHEIGTRIKAHNKKLDTIKERSVAFNFINLESYEDRHSTRVHASGHGNPSGETSSDFDRLGVAGDKIEEDTRALVAQILQTGTDVSINIMVVAIVGVGGIGKTTLAQKVFNDKVVQGWFSKRIWLSVNQNFSHAELLRRAIVEAGGDHRPVGDATAALHRTLKDALIGHKTLLVMDDVWDHGAWEGVLKIPFVNAAAPGSRVLITTRDEGVARAMTATWPYHHVETLAPDDAWSLLKKQVLQVNRAPCIKRLGTQFIEAPTTPFPRLNHMALLEMVEWEEWEWEEQVRAVPRLEKLVLAKCKLRFAPPGLASNSKALKVLQLYDVQHLSYLENFPCVVELVLDEIPDMERITNLPNLQKLAIIDCPKLKVLESIPTLDKLDLQDYNMEKLPEYMRGIRPRLFQLDCRLWLLSSVAAGKFSLEWDKFSHVEHIKAYAPHGNNPRKWYVLYTGRRDNFKLDSNISSSTVFQETLSSCMVDARGFESVYKMGTSTFSYICSLVRVPVFEDMMARDYTFTFVDGRVLSLQDQVAVALRVLSSGEPPEIIGSSIGVSESTVSLVTQVFVQALYEPTMNKHFRWPHSSGEMEKIKRKFNKIHSLPNCCGVLHTAHIKIGSKSHDHEDNDGVLLQIIVDPYMRFTDSLVQPSDSKGQCNLWQDSLAFKKCEEGVTLNGSTLKVSSGGGSEVGEYNIGDAGYPLRPWLLTPYKLENELSHKDFKKEFNRRHSEATAAVVQKALARLKDTWKCLQGYGWLPNNELEVELTICACCLLHNIVIDLEEDGDGMPSDWEHNKTDHVRQIADLDAVRVRDALAQHLIESRVHTMAAEEEQQAPDASTSSGDENKEQAESFREQRADQGKEKVQDC